jgi:hypothetical protein
MPSKLPRPNALPGTTYKMPTHCGNIYITVTVGADRLPFEVFVRFGKAGHCGAAIFDGMTKLVSYALRSGMDPMEVVKAFSGIICSYGGETCLNAVAEALKNAQEVPPPADDRTSYLRAGI